MNKTILFPYLGKTTKRKFLFMRLFTASILLMLSTISWAYDFRVNGIFYYINADGTSVSTTTESNNNYINNYRGNIIIPSTVSYNGVTYNVTGIGNYTFYQCNALTSVTIPEGVTRIGDYAFYEDEVLSSVNLPDGLETIGAAAFWRCLKIKLNKIPDSVKTIGSSAFYYCSNITSIELSKSMTAISGFTFNTCTNLQSVTIPNGVTTIGSGAFDFTRLTSVTLPNSVTTVSISAFNSCNSLKKMTCLAKIAPKFDGWSNVGLASNVTTLYVPASAIEDYKTASSWKDIWNILPIDDETTISVGSDGLATYCPTLNVSSNLDYYIDFTNMEDKIAAYKATIDGNTVNLTRTYKVDSSEGVLLRSLDGGAIDETLTVELIEKATKTIGSDTEANAFVGVKTDTYLNENDDEGNTNFVLSKQEDGTIGFYKARDNTLVKAGKAYLPMPNGDASDVKNLTLAFDDATGIIGVQPLQEAESDDAFYTLSGVRVATPTAKGIYIHNGKKVIIK